MLSICRDLETKIDQEQSRISANNAERIKSDLEAIVKENAALVAQIKAAAKH
jgi:flagellar biosynthesis/type III secretory pathway chaperone